MITTQDKARALGKFGTELRGLGTRLRGLSPKQLEDAEVMHVLRRAVDDMRALLDELSTALGPDN